MSSATQPQLSTPASRHDSEDKEPKAKKNDPEDHHNPVGPDPVADTRLHEPAPSRQPR